MFWQPFKYKNLPNVVRCKLCSHYCIIKENETGKCNTRLNKAGTLYAINWGMADGTAIDPIEKKPFFHFKPKTKTLSFGAYGCNFKCMNCQNWTLSQAYKYSLHTDFLRPHLTPEKIVDTAINTNSDGISYTYSEPTIFFEYAYDTIMLAKKLKPELYHVFVSNGYFSAELIDFIENEHLLDAINIDLKFINEKQYQQICGASVKPLLKNIERIFRIIPKIHIEIINLVIPDENDSAKDIKALCEFIYSLSPDIPLHFNRFYPAYMMHDKKATPINTLLKAKQIANEIGIKYVYIGNVANEGIQDTFCPNCGFLAVERSYAYRTKINYIINNNKAFCKKCNLELPIIP